MPGRLFLVAIALGTLACRTQTSSLAPEAGTEVASSEPDSGPQTPPPVPVPRTAALTVVRDCNDVTGVLRERAIVAMNEELDRGLQSAKLSHRERCRHIADAAAQPGPAEVTATGPSSYSTTNNQVADVDEADFIKNDGRYIYVATGREFRIIEAWPAATARVIAKVPLSGAPLKLFVNADRAVVYTREGGGVPRTECTYGYSCIPSGDGQPWSIHVYDITDRSQPVLLRRLTSSSSYLTARRVGTAVHSVLIKQAGKPFYPVWPSDVVSCEGQLTDAQLDAAFARLRAQNTELLRQIGLDSELPAISDTIYPRGGGASITTSNLLVGCDSFYSEGDPSSRNFATVVSIDMTKEAAPSLATIFSSPGAVYASAGALYLAVPQAQRATQGWFSGWEGEPELTTIHKFTLDQASASYAASGAVKGHVLNQFAMDEHQAHLRVATTTGHPPSADVHSTLSVLKDGGDEALKEVGRLDRLAPTEDIRSVRFDGPRGYMVTFKKTDPLFVLDLADPAKPRVEAELKIPGFSTYIHRMNDRYLLTIGYDAADQGDFAYFTGVLLQIFDVSDPKAPTLAHKHVIGTRGSSSEALTNHLAFNYFPPKDALLLPMTICDNVADNIFAARPSFSGLIAFDTTTSNGFRERGRISFTPPQTVNCGNWWSNASSIVQRSIIMDDIVFSISATEIKASALDTLATPVATLRLND